MGKKTPPFPEYEAWTTSRYWGFVRSALRQAFTRWPPKYQVLKDSCRLVYETDEEGEPLLYKTGKREGEQRTHKEYICRECEGWVRQKEIEVDHIVPAGSLKESSDLPGFVERLFVSEDKMQTICKPCHKAKTKRDRG